MSNTKTSSCLGFLKWYETLSTRMRSPDSVYPSRRVSSSLMLYLLNSGGPVLAVPLK